MKQPPREFPRSLLIIALLVAIPIWYFSVPITIDFGKLAWEAGGMQSWEEVSATLTKVKLKHRRINPQNETEPPEYDSYVAVEFEYVYQEKSYRGQSVGTHPKFSWQRSGDLSIVNQLTPYLKPNELFRCFVNPDQPSEAVLFRKIGWSFMALGVLLGLFPTVFVIYFFIGHDDSRNPG